MAYIKNGITFNSFDGDSSKVKKTLSNNKYDGATVDDLAEIEEENGGKLPKIINAVEIDWNGAVINGQTINSTGELLKERIQQNSPMFAEVA